ncbi:MAG: TolC family protein [Candidatus Binataceae bacterium]|jgi:outer membrane protein
MSKPCASLALSGWLILMLSALAIAGADLSPIIPGSQLTLKDAIAIALKYHPRGLEAAAQSGAAGERVGEARAALLPQVYGSAQYLRSTANGIGNTEYYDVGGMFPRETGRNHDLPSNDFSQSSETYNNYIGGLSFSQFLLDFGRRRGFVDQRKFEAAAVKAQQQLVDLDLIFEVSQRYFGLLAAQQLVRVYEKAIEQRRFHLHEAQVKASANLRPQLDIYVTQAELERAQLHLVEARNAVADGKVALDNAMGLSEAAPDYQPAAILTYGKISDTMEALVCGAMRQRPDLAAIEDQVRAMGAQIQEYRSDYLPTVNAMGGYNALGAGLPAVNNFNVGLVITWPLFNGFLTTHQVEEATLEQKALAHAIDDLRQRVIFEVKTAFLDWQASLERIQRAERAVAASSVELELADKRYEAGLTNIVELEDAQRHYTSDDADYANALYGFSLTKAQVDRATARSLTAIPGH